MKKQTTTLLIIGAAAAAWFIFTSMRKRRGSSVEAGPTIKQTAEEFEAETPQQPAIVKTAQSVLDIFKTLKRSPEKKAAAVSKKQLKKATKLGVKQAKKLSAGFGGCNGLY